MAARRRFTRRRFTRRRRLTRWTGDFNTAVNSVSGPAFLAQIITGPTDFQQSATLEETGPTLLRTVGQLTFRNTGIVRAILHAHILVIDDFIGLTAIALDPSIFENFKEGNQIWRYTTFLDPDETIRIDLDTTVRRRLRDHNVVFAYQVDLSTVINTVALKTLLAGSF